MSLEESNERVQLIRVLNSDGYHVVSWCPTEDGTGKPEAVGVILPIFGKGDEEIKIMLRLKTRRAVNEMIFALERHREDVFPESDPAQKARGGN